MQQITKEERLFVGFFIACCRGHEKLLDRLKTLNIQFDHHAATEAGRNLFHAAAASGEVNCVEFVAKHLIKPSKEILTMLDTNRETPIDIARRLNHHDAERLLYKYMYREKGERQERNSTESGIDLSEECDQSSQMTPRRETTSKREHFRWRKTAQVRKRESRGEISPRQVRRTSPSSSSESSDESSNISPRLTRPQTLNVQSNQHLLQRRFKETDPRRPKSARTVRCPPSIYLEEAEEEDDENHNHLPPLQGQMRVHNAGGNALSSSASTLQLRRMKQAVFRTDSTPNSPAPKQRLTPSDETSADELVTKSAPGSPQNPRLSFKPSMPTVGSIPPVSPRLARALDRRRGSEPVAALSRVNGVRFPRTRRDAVITADLHADSSKVPLTNSPMMYRRCKARSICEVSLSDSLREQRCYKDMDGEEERLDRPWNAWIAVRKESLQPMIQEPAPDPTNPRRMSFQQWISEKELNHLRSLFANAQEEAKTNEKQAKLLKGKTFEEWMEDKHREIERERERERGVEDQQKFEQDKKHQRRRMSQVKYDKWLMQKERDALLMEEKREQLAKQKREILKKKWEEQDEMKRNCKQALGRTHSLPITEERAVPRAASAINKHRFTSLK
ncbi:hypothetical protein OS493_018687 [Desmophyllum pertusum]|uniref:Uncharacterized protein n=1 Tax=Desmophyllum pertusum TaxID=174260 RepID=A0A9W9ZQK2_9CNID|nr:hypothetical protein OS493_018687 [Desmophyllum pertusum]